MIQAKCLSEQELSEFVRGRIGADRVEQIAEHLEACGDCQSTVVMLGENSDTFIEQLRSPAVSDALEAEDACQVAVERLAARAAEGASGPVATSPVDAQIERVGPYQIRAQLGVGGMGTVFEAVHTKLKRSVALKLLPASRWANPAAVARFEREMAVIGQLDHPNIVRASDAGEENGMHYLVMEHVVGLDLSRVVSRLGRLEVTDACEIARQAAIGLQYAHENHLVHRDVKPSNLMLAAGGHAGRQATVKILDLGLALLGESRSGQENELTTVGQLMGTIDYMSPEQGMDSHDVDVRADIYSLGATLYKLLTGSAPFAAPQYNTLLKKVTALANKPVTPIKQVRSDIPDEAAAVIDRMLAKDPADRFGTPAEVTAALEPHARSADLGTLLATALEVGEPQAARVPPASRPMALPTAPKVAPKHPAPRSHSSRWRLVLSLVVLMILGAVFTVKIATDRGELIVRAAEPVKVTIRKDGNTVKQFAVGQGENAVTVWSGSYRVELDSKSDELVLSRNTVSIQRGGRVVLQVLQRPKVASRTMRMQDSRPANSMMNSSTIEDDTGAMMEGAMMGSGMMAEMMGSEMMGSGMMGSEMGEMKAKMAGEEKKSSAGGMAMMGMVGSTAGGAHDSSQMMSGLGAPPATPSKPEPTYDGQRYGNWLATLRSERKPERLTEAVRALGALVDTKDLEESRQAAQTILHVMRRYGLVTVDKSSQGTLNEQALTVLTTLQGEAVVDALEVELQEGTGESRAFSMNLLAPNFAKDGNDTSYHNEGIAATVDARHTELAKLLLHLPDTDSVLTRFWGVSLVINRAKAQNVPYAKVDGLVPRLHDLLRKEDDALLLNTACDALISAEPDHELLVPTLIRIASGQSEDWHDEAVRQLGRLGPRAAPAVEMLSKRVATLLKMLKSGSTAASRMEGMDSISAEPGVYGGGMSKTTRSCAAAIETLGNIGPAAKEALPLLKPLTKPGDKFVSIFQPTAAIAVAKIEGRQPPENWSDFSEEDRAESYGPAY